MSEKKTLGDIVVQRVKKHFEKTKNAKPSPREAQKVIVRVLKEELRLK